ncbi:hypothetical protein DMN91_007983 [Ooceraea biroi]|uniref:DUF4817 domain-containing protein n=1 Tax=Ooceraea biroi TaxID=2015173 RepID=A0A3L8DGI7_OOCBI|nr:uncharacterized protein LOC105280838 [Ooceraea biroi]RLU19426.1 hypothetical protein DMN91_007983 [Ooceraea biroi]
MVRALRTLVARIRLLITSCPAEIAELCNDNLKAAQRVYAARFPDRRYPTRKTMKLLLRRAQQGYLKRNRKKTGPKENNILVTLAAVELNPNISTRNIENEHSIPQKTMKQHLPTEED